jgi:predicted component of type VI protein secretion system
MQKVRMILGLVVLVGVLAGCSKSDPTPALVAVTFKNLSADPPSGGYNPANGQPIGVTNKYILFSFATGATPCP